MICAVVAAVHCVATIFGGLFTQGCAGLLSKLTIHVRKACMEVDLVSCRL